MTFASGRVDFSNIDTEPGSNSWSAPAKPVESYEDWLRVQYRAQRDMPVYLMTAARLKFVAQAEVTITGPYADDLLTLLGRISGLA